MNIFIDIVKINKIYKEIEQLKEEQSFYTASLDNEEHFKKHIQLEGQIIKLIDEAEKIIKEVI